MTVRTKKPKILTVIVQIVSIDVIDVKL